MYYLVAKKYYVVGVQKIYKGDLVLFCIKFFVHIQHFNLEKLRNFHIFWGGCS